MIRSTCILLALALFSASCQDAPANASTGSVLAQGEAAAPAAEAAAPVAQAADPAAVAAPTEPATEPAADAPVEHFGAPFALTGPALSVDDAIRTCADTGQPCRVEGTIEAVCQRRGCWFSLVAPDVPTTVRVRMLDYGFFVPSDTSGAHCLLEGTLTTATIAQDVAQHYADEEVAPGETPRQVTGPETSYEFVITGVDIRRM